MSYSKNILWLVILLTTICTSSLHAQKKEYSQYLFSQYLSKGIDLELGLPVNDQDIKYLANSNPTLVTVTSNGYPIYELLSMAETGVHIILEEYKKKNEKLNQFDYEKLIKACPNNLTIEYHGFPVDLEEAVRNNINLRIVKNLSEYRLRKLVKSNPDLFTIVSENNPRNLSEYLKLGARVEVNHKMKIYPLEGLIKRGKNSVRITCDKYTYSELRKFIDLGAEVVIGKPLSRKEITKLVQSNPHNVRVDLTYYTMKEIQAIAKYGLKKLKYNTNIRK